MVDRWKLSSLFSRLPEVGVCLLCDAPATQDLCDPCAAELPHINNPCPRCALPLQSNINVSCGTCQVSPPSFHRCVAPLEYAWPVDALVTGFKSGGKLPYGRLLSGQLATSITAAYTHDALPSRLIATPLQGARLRQRGFNQAAQIAKFLGRRFGLPIELELFKNMREVDTQKTLPAHRRRSNLRGAFSLREPVSGHLGLIDDVMTTGATANALSEILLAAGAARIDVWCLARTPAPSRDNGH